MATRRKTKPSPTGRRSAAPKKAVRRLQSEQLGNALAWGAKVSATFRKRVREICADLQIDPDYLMACMAFESAETFSPKISNPMSKAVGLIQFMPKTAQSLGTTTEALASLSAVEQLDYVHKYFAPYRGKIKSLEDTYTAILWPAAIGKPNQHPLFKSPSVAYLQNKGLDIDQDGIVSKFEAAEFPRKKLGKGLGPGYTA